MGRFSFLLFAAIALVACGSNAEERQTPPPHMVVAQRLLSNLPNIPNAIQEGMEGKHGEIRKMVSNVLGDGLISQLVVNPMSIASQFGIDLDQFGINKTLTNQVLGTPTATTNSAGLKPDTLSTGEQGEKIWSSDQMMKKKNKPATTSEEEPLYVNGHLIANEDAFRESIQSEMRIRPQHPAFVQDRPTEPSITTTTATTTTTSTKSAQSEMAEKVLNALGKSLFSPDYTSTQPPQTPSSVTFGNDQVVVEPEFKWDEIDPKRLGEVSNLLRRAPPRIPMPPSPQSVEGFTQTAELSQPSISADSVFSYFKNRDLSSLSPEEVHGLQSYLQTYEQNLQTKELLTKRQKLQQLQNRLNEHKRKMDEQRSRQQQLRMQELELVQQRRNVEEQLKKQLNKWHNSFNPNNNEVQQLNAVDDYSTDSASIKTSIEQAIPPPMETPVRIPPTLETPVRTPGRSISVLQNQLRYSPEIRRKPQKTAVFNESEFTSTCECVEIDLQRMKGVWMQSLASPQGLNMQQMGVGQVFGTEEAIVLNCSSIELGKPQQSEAAQDARITWTFRTENSRKLFRLSGSVLTMDHRTIRVQFNDYNGGKIHFPVCALKTSYSSSGPYEYVVLVEANTCKSASLLVRNPETFFDKDNSELIHFLQHKVRENELEEMDVVPHEGTCADE